MSQILGHRIHIGMRQVRFFVTAQTNEADSGVGQQVLSHVQHAQAGPHDRNDQRRIRHLHPASGRQRRVDLDVDHGLIPQRLIDEKARELFEVATEFRALRGLVPHAGEAFND